MIQTCLTLKALFGWSLRQATGLAASLLRPAKLDWPVPDCSTSGRRQSDLTITMAYGLPRGRGSHLLLGSTGIRTMGDDEWATRKHGTSHPRQ